MKAQVFISSSTESIDIARAIQAELEPEFDCTIWNQQTFRLTKSHLNNLIDILSASDFGVFVFSPDDATTIRGQAQSIVRDNVIFELGLFIGKMGAYRSFFVLPAPICNLHLPSDLAGISGASYDPDRPNRQAALGGPCTRIRNAIRDTSSDPMVPGQEQALDQVREPTLELLVAGKLIASVGDAGARAETRTRVLTTLPHLDGLHKAILLRFLYKANLISRDETVIDLSGADLTGVDLSKAWLRASALRNINLTKANLKSVVLRRSSLRGATLSGADLTSADLTAVNLAGANLTGAILRDANLTQAGVSEEQWKAAAVLDGATMPDGTKYSHEPT